MKFGPFYTDRDRDRDRDRNREDESEKERELNVEGQASRVSRHSASMVCLF